MNVTSLTRIALAAMTFAVAAVVAGCADTPESLVASAKGLLGKNDRSGAIIQLRSALQKSPDMPEARYLLGVSLIETGDFLGAEKELRRADDLRYDRDKVVPALARSLVLRGEHQKALDEFATVTLNSPNAKAELQTTLGKARMATGSTLDAGRDFAAALAARPDYPPALVGQARLKVASGDLPAAIALVDAALAIDPQLTEAWQLKGDIANARRQRDQALASYRKAVETNPNDVQAHYALVAALVQDGLGEEAGKELAAMKKVAPKHPETLLLESVLALRQGNVAAAREAVQAHLKATPNSLAGLLLGAQIEYKLGNFAQAESVLLIILNSLPDQPAARTLLTQTYLRRGNPAGAMQALKPLLQDDKLDSDLLSLAGEVYMQNGDAATAAQYFEKAAALDPKNTEKRTAVALSHLAKGERDRGIEELQAVAGDDTGIRADLALLATQVRDKQFDAALATVDSIGKKQPDKPLPHNLRGGVLLGKGDVAGARRSFEAALKIDPSFLPAAVNLAQLDVKDKKSEDAKKRFEGVLAKDPKNSKALLALASLRSAAGGSPEEVAALIGKAVAANPADVEAQLALISIWMVAKQPKKAVAAAQDALAALPERSEIVDVAAQVYRAAGDNNQAIATYNRLAQLRPRSPLPFMRIAEIHILAKENAAAIEDLRKALAIKPELLGAQRALIALNLEGGHGGDALAAARDIQKQRPKEAVGYVLEGNIHAYNKEWSQAAAAYRAALQQSDSADIATYVHGALAASGRGQEADGFAAAWIRGHPKDTFFLQYLAQLAIDGKNYASAVKQYKAMLDIEPNNALALNNLAWVAGQLKDPKAIDYAAKADKLAPNTPAILDTYGMLLVESGETARGLEALKKAVSLAPKSAQIRLNLVAALVKDGQKDAARAQLDAVAKLGGKYVGQAETAKMMLGL